MASSALLKARNRIETLQKSTRKARAKAGEVVKTVVETGETVGTAFAFGLYEGNLSSAGQFELFGVPMPLVVGIGSHAFALMGVGQGMESHLRAIGNGALCAHLNGIGRSMGLEMKSKRTSPAVVGEASPSAAPALAAPEVAAPEVADIDSLSRRLTAADLLAMAQ